ncbi:amidohydrolase [Streptomyces sp. NRRL WC-3618]|uniref:amidohydrolase n=1 Tax=Streptomyces sp. NRRL WC-3618 TaxID=1519490 RepID=UPI0006AE5880|nr:amidohydrolase [Streptomyces sp. NRRL WC-3618]KOV80471.1 amidohydrolase [Streptomyces sp. NRRL WC-3618]
MSVVLPGTSETPAVGPLHRRTFLAAAGAGALTVAGAGTAAQASTGSAPVRVATVVLNGRVFTGAWGDTPAQAVAVGSDGKVLAVGRNTDICRRIGPRTVVIDADGGTVMPGIQDGHMHPLGAAAQSLNPSLGNVSMTIPQFRAKLQELLDASAAQEPDGWLQVADWNPVGLLPAGTVGDKSLLDSLNTRRPIHLQGSDFHNSLVNSRALALAGIDRNTPDPVGGQIVRDANREPTGLLKDDAQGLVSGVIPAPSAELILAAQVKMAGMLLAAGITSFLDASSAEESVKTYADLMARGLLPQHVTPALVIDAELAKKPKEAAEYLRGVRGRFAGPARLRLTTVKVFLDGVMEFPAQSAALLDPYLDAQGRPTDNLGPLHVSDRDYRDLVRALDADGWQMHAHAIGDRAVRTALNAYEAVAHHGHASRRHTITHLQLVHPDDYRRFARAGVVASMQLQWAMPSSFTNDALRPYVGPERYARLYPAHSLARAGALLAGGSDWPVDPLLPFTQIATAIDRSNPAENQPPLNTREALTRFQSLAMHTAGAAYQLHDGNSGTVRPGRRADLVVLDQDITKVPVKEIRATKVQYTLVSGRVVHEAKSDTGRARAEAARGMKTLGAGRASGGSCCQGH